MKSISRSAIIGYPAGVITGITYGLNPLFAVPLMRSGASVPAILFFRYIVAVLLLGAFLLLKRQSFAISWKQAGILALLGILFASSSSLLFEAYKFIPSGLATILVFLYPVFVALIMVLFKVVPSWPVWVSIAATFGGVVIMTQSDATMAINPIGVCLSLGSALAYALFIVIINRNKTICTISNTLLTFYALLFGSVLFFVRILFLDTAVTTGLDSYISWIYLVALAILPTIVSTATLAIATRNIGATKASVMGVFEPITAVLVGTVVFGEALTTNMVVGILLSIAAITFMIVLTKR